MGVGFRGFGFRLQKAPYPSTKDHTLNHTNHPQMGVSQNYGYLIGGRQHKDCRGL